MVSLYTSSETEPLVLDNLINSIRPLSSRKDLSLKFSFDLNGNIGQADPQQKVKQWSALMEKIKREGFLLN
jgi:hypothetical protein